MKAPWRAPAARSFRQVRCCHCVRCALYRAGWQAARALGASFIQLTFREVRA